MHIINMGLRLVFGLVRSNVLTSTFVHQLCGSGTMLWLTVIMVKVLNFRDTKIYSQERKNNYNRKRLMVVFIFFPHRTQVPLPLSPSPPPQHNNNNNNNNSVPWGSRSPLALPLATQGAGTLPRMMSVSWRKQR